MPDEVTRRAFLTGLTAALAPLPGLSAVALLCPSDPSVSSLAAPLTIDVHAHVFNGSDLQIKEFLSQTTVGRDSELFPLVSACAGILQAVAWHVAPNARAEEAAIAKYAARLQDCDGADQMRRVAGDAYQDGYALGRRELQIAATAISQPATGAGVLGPSAEQVDLGAAIAALPDTYEEFEVRRADSASVLGSRPSALGHIRFVLQNFNHRHVNAIDYLTSYSKGSSRKIDLLVACMVDYDWWLARGRPTPTSLQDQVDVMSQVAILLGGRVHGFVPFCPFREAMTVDASGVGSAMRLVRRAIETRGFIGVKMYPPMGFAPWGNTGRTEWRGKTSLASAAASPDFGRRLDAALRVLYTYCIEKDVPIMAHTNQSNGPYEEFRALAGSSYWERALEEFPGLRVSFGHFGDTDPEDHGGAGARRFLKLMSEGANSHGANAYADSSYFAGVLMNQGNMRDVLRSLFDDEERILLGRLMYGTDWSMILPQKNAGRYLSDFIDVMRRIEDAEPGLRVRQTTLSNAFFGRNAVEFLGLRSGRKNRARLERFYLQNGIPEPDWMKKVSAI